MSPIANFSPSVQPFPAAPLFADDEVDIEQLAIRKIAAEFHLPITIAKVVVDHAGIGGGRQ